MVMLSWFGKYIYVWVSGADLEDKEVQNDYYDIHDCDGDVDGDGDGDSN